MCIQVGIYFLSLIIYRRGSTHIFFDVPFYNLYECRVLPIQTNSVLSKNFKLDFLLCLLYIRSCLPSPNNIIQNNVPEQYTQHHIYDHWAKHIPISHGKGTIFYNIENRLGWNKFTQDGLRIRPWYNKMKKNNLWYIANYSMAGREEKRPLWVERRIWIVFFFSFSLERMYKLVLNRFLVP